MTLTTDGAAHAALDLLPKAREVWKMMAEGDPPLMAQPAVDMLLDETDGAARRRGECVRLLWAAGAEWVEAAAPPPHWVHANYVLGRAVVSLRRGVWSTPERQAARITAAVRRMLDKGILPTASECADAYLPAARRIRTAARLVRDLKKCP